MCEDIFDFTLTTKKCPSTSIHEFDRSHNQKDNAYVILPNVCMIFKRFSSVTA